MQFEIEVIAVTSSTKPTAKGSYIQLDVAYKRVDNGKVEGKKIMSFTHKEVFAALKDANNGSRFTVTSEKVGEYWQWTGVTKGGSVTTPTTATPATPTPKSTYETA